MKINKKYLAGSKNPKRRAALIKQIANIYKKGKPYPKNLDSLMKERDSLEMGGKVKEYKKGGKFPDLTGDGKVTFADVLKGRGVGEKKAMGGMKMPKYMMGGKMKKFKKGGMAGLSGPQKEVYRRGLAAYMSSGNRPKTSQHAWAMARVKSAFGKREAAKIRAGKSKKK
tara:strand:- start:219 stop:725 length:507 start_codon:yes stop_codon:yes gene_type:complete